MTEPIFLVVIVDVHHAARLRLRFRVGDWIVGGVAWTYCPCLSPTLSLITIFSAGDGAAVSITIGKVPLVRALPAVSRRDGEGVC